MFHVGHLNIIRSAKEMCDYLIVGVSTDELCLNYKKHYPIIPFDERFKILESIKYIDEVIPQYELDKLKIVKMYGINVVFHGDDDSNRLLYNDISQKLKPMNVEVVLLPYTKSISSSILSQKVKRAPKINYRSISDMRNVLYRKLSIIPSNFDYVVGVPKSGLLPATLIAINKNIELISIEKLIGNIKSNCNINSKNWKKHSQYDCNKSYDILLVDDSVNTGEAINNAKALIKRCNSNLNIYTLCVFSTMASLNEVDYALEICEQPRVFEWNIVHNRVLEKTLISAKGLLVVDDCIEGCFNVYGRKIHTVFNDTNLPDSKLKEFLSNRNVEFFHLLSSPNMCELYITNSDLCFSIVYEDENAKELFEKTNKPVLCFKSGICYETKLEYE